MDHLRSYLKSLKWQKISKDCGILNLFKSGDYTMADRGFNIKDDLPPGRCSGEASSRPSVKNSKWSISLDQQCFAVSNCSRGLITERGWYDLGNQ